MCSEMKTEGDIIDHMVVVSSTSIPIPSYTDTECDIYLSRYLVPVGVLRT